MALNTCSPVVELFGKDWVCLVEGGVSLGTGEEISKDSLAIPFLPQT